MKLFSQQFWSGDLYPRWIMDMYAGNGSPVFFYYPPLIYYTMAPFHFLTPLDGFGYYPILISAFMALLTAGFAMHTWLREETEESAALMGSLFYIVSPYFMGHNFYNCLMPGTVWAYAWAPLLLRASRHIALGKPHGVARFSIFLGLLILTNVPSTIILGPLVIAYGLWRANKHNMKYVIAKLTAATVLGFGLAAIYLIPAAAYFHYSDAFLTYGTPTDNYSSVFVPLRFGNLVSAIFSSYWLGMLAITIILYMASAGSPYKKIRLFSFAASLFSLAMMLRTSDFLWKLFPILQILQFTDRFFTATTVFTAALAALALPRYHNLVRLIMMVFIVLVSVEAWRTPRLTMDAWRQSYPSSYEQYRLNIDQYDTYLPAPELDYWYYRPEGIAYTKKHLGQVELLNGDAHISVEEWKPRSVTLHVDAKTPSTIEMHRFYYPGLTALVNGKSQEIDLDNDEKQLLRLDNKTGQVIINVPPGSSTLHFTLTQMLPEIVGKLVSIISLMALALLILMGIKKHNGDSRITI